MSIEEIEKILRNPAEVHIIQDKLISLKGESIFAHSVRIGAKNDLNECLKMILSQAHDNRLLVSKLIGERLLKEIESL